MTDLQLNEKMAEFMDLEPKLAGTLIGVENTYVVGNPPEYTKDLNLIFETIIEKLKTEDPLGRVWRLELGFFNEWYANIELLNDNASDDVTFFNATNESPARAICLAVLDYHTYFSETAEYYNNGGQ